MFEQIISDSKYDISIFTQAEIESIGANVTATETNGRTVEITWGETANTQV
jgi:hypothetical protein